jgi:hypothetical protein
MTCPDASRTQVDRARRVASDHPSSPRRRSDVGAPRLSGCHRSGYPLSLPLLSHSDVGIRVGAEGAVAGGTGSGDHSGSLHRSQLSKRKGRGGNGRILGAHVPGLASPHGLVPARGVVLDRRNAPKQQFTPALTLPHVRYGLSVLLIEAFLTLGVSSICRHVQRQ